METMIIIILIIMALMCIGIYWLYMFAFGRRKCADDYHIPQTEQYLPFAERIKANVSALLAEKYEEVHIISHDGLCLYGRYYGVDEKAPLAIFFHGYRSTAARDANGGFYLCKKLGWNVLLVDERAHGRSQGKALTMGVKERFDCVSWIKYARERFGKDTKIILIGVSMGAATVLMSSDAPEIEGIKCIIADCGYSSAKGILTDVASKMGIPGGLAYPFVRFAARAVAGFDPDEHPATEALKNARAPVLFIHGEADRFVPFEMSRENYEACSSEKEFLAVKNAGHGMCYYADTEKYEKTVTEFCSKYVK